MEPLYGIVITEPSYADSVLSVCKAGGTEPVVAGTQPSSNYGFQ